MSIYYGTIGDLVTYGSIFFPRAERYCRGLREMAPLDDVVVTDAATGKFKRIEPGIPFYSVFNPDRSNK